MAEREIVSDAERDSEWQREREIVSDTEREIVSDTERDSEWQRER